MEGITLALALVAFLALHTAGELRRAKRCLRSLSSQFERLTEDVQEIEAHVFPHHHKHGSG